jgi:tetratricopeptide (TPR) repeat protein
MNLAANRKLPEMLALAKQTVQQKPTPAGYAVLAEACRRSDDLTSAQAALQKGLELYPQNARLVQAYRALQGPQIPASVLGSLPAPGTPVPRTEDALRAEAARVIAALVTSLPHDPESLDLQARFQAWQKAPDAETTSSKAAEPAARAEAAAFYTDAGQIFFACERMREAEWLWQRAGALAAQDTRSRRHLAVLHQQLGRWKETLAVIEELAQIEPKDPAHHLDLGRLHARLGETDAAEREFQAVCTLAADDAAGYSELAQLYLRTGRKLPECVELARKAAELSPTAGAFALLSAAYRSNGKEAEAAQALQKAAALQEVPPVPPPQQALGQRSAGD